MTEPLTDPTPLCPVCGCGVVDDLETTAAGVYAHGECLGEAAMLTAISDRDREIDDLRGRLGRAEGSERRDLLQLEVNRRLHEAAAARDDAEIKSEESRRRVAAAEVELDAARSALDSRVLLDVLDDDEVQAKIQIRIAYALAKVFGAFGIDLDNPPVIAEPDGWIVGSVDSAGDVDLDWGEMIYRDRTDAEGELTHDRREWADGDFRLYEVREARA